MRSRRGTGPRAGPIGAVHGGPARLAAYLVWSARRESPPQAILDRLHEVQRFLETHESHAAGAGDVAGVGAPGAAVGRRRAGPGAARDRLLERLYQNGLRPEQDLPGFLRFAGQATGQRSAASASGCGDMAEKAHDWIGRQGMELTAQGGDAENAGVQRPAVRLRPGPAGGARRGPGIWCAGPRPSWPMRTTLTCSCSRALSTAFIRCWTASAHGGPLPDDQMEYLEHLRKSRQPRTRCRPGLRGGCDARRRPASWSRTSKFEPYRSLARIAGDWRRWPTCPTCGPGGVGRARRAALLRTGAEGDGAAIGRGAGSCERPWTRRRGSASMFAGELLERGGRRLSTP